MRAALLRIVSAAILGLCAAIASVNAAQAAADLEHSCCPRTAPADSLTAPDVPCNGFLPLTCCHAAALPGGDHASLPAPAAFAKIVVAALQAMPPAAVTRAENAALWPRIAATRLTVVRQL